MEGFKKRTKAAGGTSGRKRARRESEDDDADGAADGGVAEVAQSLDQLREDQRLRRELRPSAKRASSGASQPQLTASAGASAPQFGLHDPKKDGSAGEKLLHLLDGQFTGQSTTTQKDQHEELLNKYIDEKLGKSRAADSEDAAKDPLAALRSEEDALYALPEHLKPDVPPASMGAGDESGNGGVLLWSTGIAEVELPETFREKTEAATKLALQRERVKSGCAAISSALPTNFSTDFNRHRSAFDDTFECVGLTRGGLFVLVLLASRCTVGKNQSSDDAAVARFRKFESRRKFR
ncbi:hypothetical protein PybrP1_008502 [[Pythium] brassicae (nom. inval.)]|nr:hypothetical protein PybrP1_008502 [[Pythium] brassicae (nom. inval.)]